MKKQQLNTTQLTHQTEDGFVYAGFKNLNSTPIPDEFFDLLAVNLSEAELRVLLYVMRRTFGFKKKADAISLSQLTGGIRRRDGSVLDYGTGLSRPAVLKAVNGLEAKGILSIEKRTGYDGRNEVNVYQLRFRDEAEQNNNIPDQATFNQNDYSASEYYISEQRNISTPDPRFTSARAVKGSPATAIAGERYEQKPIGENSPVNRQSTRVKLNNPGSKAGLPGGYDRGKAGLPGPVNSVDQEGKTGIAKGVKLVDPQHGILQPFRIQKSRIQTTEPPAMLLQAEGSLALQDFEDYSDEDYSDGVEIDETEMVEYETDNQEETKLLELVTAMRDLGLGEKLTYEFVSSYPQHYLWEKVQLTRKQLGRDTHQPGVRNTAGYLRRAIEENYSVGGRGTGVRGREIGKGSQGTDDLPPTGARPRFTPNGGEATIYPQRGRGRDLRLRESLSVLSPQSSVLPSPAPDPHLWERVLEDLEGRYRLGTALALLEGSELLIEESEGQRRVQVLLKSLWQERELGMAARSAIGMALRQRLGPGYSITFGSGE